MKLEDMGIDPVTKIHNARLTWMENAFLGFLWIDHVGEENAISADELAMMLWIGVSGLDIGGRTVKEAVAQCNRVTPHRLGEWKRDVRYLQNHLLEEHEHVPVLSKAGQGGGYWIAATEEEVAAFYDTFRKRGFTGIKKASRGKKAVLTEIVEQLTFDFEDLDDRTGQAPGAGGRGSGIGDRGDGSAPIAVVDAFLKRMLDDPEKYATGLKMIGKKYGGVLLPKGQLEAARAKARELTAIVEGMV